MRVARRFKRRMLGASGSLEECSLFFSLPLCVAAMGCLALLSSCWIGCFTIDLNTHLAVINPNTSLAGINPNFQNCEPKQAFLQGHTCHCTGKLAGPHSRMHPILPSHGHAQASLPQKTPVITMLMLTRQVAGWLDA